MMRCFLLRHTSVFYFGCVKYQITFQTDEANCIEEVEMLLHEYIDSKKKAQKIERVE